MQRYHDFVRLAGGHVLSVRVYSYNSLTPVLRTSCVVKGSDAYRPTRMEGSFNTIQQVSNLRKINIPLREFRPLIHLLPVVQEKQRNRHTIEAQGLPQGGLSRASQEQSQRRRRP